MTTAPTTLLLLLLLSLVCTGVVLAQSPGASLTVTVTSFPAYDPNYPVVCTSCPCAAYTTAVKQSKVSGRITWNSSLGPATNYKVALYLLMPDTWWWAKPTFTNRYAAVNASGFWSTTVYSYCLDPQAFKIAAFVMPTTANPDTLQDGRVCPCNSGKEMFLDIGCLPPAQQGYPSTVVKRGVSDPYFYFQGHTFYKKQCTTACGPGDHQFNRSNVAVTAQGIELSIKKSTTGVWSSAEVYNVEALGYGTYLLQTTGPLVPFDLHCTLGLFLYDDCSSDAASVWYRELDFEFARWNSNSDPGAQYVVQPYTVPSNIFKYPVNNQTGSQTVTLVMDWNATRIRFATIFGATNLANLASTPAANVSRTWKFTNAASIPTPGFAKLHLNAWIQTGLNPVSTSTLTYVVNAFQFSTSNDLLWPF